MAIFHRTSMHVDQMPVAFIGHGNPLNVVEAANIAEWRAWGVQLPTPKAILAVSAHWEDAPVSIGTTDRHNDLVYDFGGFPDFMYRLDYAAPGAPDLADRVEDVLHVHTDVARTDRGLDHGVWVPLIHLFPKADVPVLQISMPIAMSDGELYALGGELSPLRSEGVLILGTGNLTHNLREAFRADPDAPPPAYAVGFDAWAARALERRDHTALQAWTEAAPEALRSHPSAEHFRPLLVTAGAARGDEAGFPVEGFEMGIISRRSVQFA
jgi:4,5-DOPA dioxygenase extradiol